MTTAVTAKDLDRSGIAANSLDKSSLLQDKSGLDMQHEEAHNNGKELQNDEEHIHLWFINEALDDPSLHNELLYIKLRARVTAFFTKHEHDKTLAISNPAKAELL